MKYLQQAGLDLTIDDTTNKISFGPQVCPLGQGTKYVKDLMGLLRDNRNLNPAEPCYDIYRGIANTKEKGLFEKLGLRYDITVIMSGTLNGELKKTSGHYHGYIPSQTATYPEIYEVLMGKAMYILQKPKDHIEIETKSLEIKEFILAEVHEGESIIIPSGYGHCSINIGNSPLVFSNIAVISCPLYYDPVKSYRGMAYYILRGENDSLKIEKNPNYNYHPEPRLVRVKENPYMGIVFGHPVYTELILNPNIFSYLKDPSNLEDKIMDMLL